MGKENDAKLEDVASFCILVPVHWNSQVKSKAMVTFTIQIISN